MVNNAVYTNGSIHINRYTKSPDHCVGSMAADSLGFVGLWTCGLLEDEKRDNGQHEQGNGQAESQSVERLRKPYDLKPKMTVCQVESVL